MSTFVTQLSSDTLEKLQDLIRINIDSYEGFKTAAEAVKDQKLATLFSDYAQQRVRFSQELQQQVKFNYEEPAESETWQGKVHRWWLDLRAKISGGDGYAVLAEVERGEDRIKAVYEEVIQQTQGHPINALLVSQQREVQQSHDYVRDLRDAAKRTK
jgi:uncharacterized protein (TIGR02284 family)